MTALALHSFAGVALEHAHNLTRGRVACEPLHNSLGIRDDVCEAFAALHVGALTDADFLPVETTPALRRRGLFPPRSGGRFNVR